MERVSAGRVRGQTIKILKKNHFRDTLSPCSRYRPQIIFLSALMMQTLRLANMMFASILFPQTEKSPVLDIQKLIKTFYKAAFG